MCVLSLPEKNIPNPALADLMQEVLARGASFRFTAPGTSMSPLIHDGEILVISPLGGRKPALGQVLAYRHPETGGLIVHRLIGRRGTHWVLRGDRYATQAADVVPAENILGLVTLIERAGHPTRFGLGVERIPIALLSRYSLLVPSVQLLRKIKWLGIRIIQIFKGKSD